MVLCIWKCVFVDAGGEECVQGEGEERGVECAMYHGVCRGSIKCLGE